MTNENWWPEDAPYPRRPLPELTTFELNALCDHATSRLEGELQPGERNLYLTWLNTLLHQKVERFNEAREARAKAKAQMNLN